MPKKILILEDEEELSDAFRVKLEKKWFEVITAQDGFYGLNYVVKYNPDLILLDIMMPDMDGFETLSILKEQIPMETKIIVFSNLKWDDNVNYAKELWANEYLVKADYTPAQVVERVKELLNISENNDLEKKSTSGSENLTYWGWYKCPHCWWEIKIELMASDTGKDLPECPYCWKEIFIKLKN